jgi:hypothetical protein
MKASRKLRALAVAIPTAAAAVLGGAPLAHADAGPYCLDSQKNCGVRTRIGEGFGPAVRDVEPAGRGPLRIPAAATAARAGAEAHRGSEESPLRIAVDGEWRCEKPHSGVPGKGDTGHGMPGIRHQEIRETL